MSDQGKYDPEAHKHVGDMLKEMGVGAASDELSESEEALHIAVTQAVGVLNSGGPTHEVSRILRTALVAWADTVYPNAGLPDLQLKVSSEIGKIEAKPRRASSSEPVVAAPDEALIKRLRGLANVSERLDGLPHAAITMRACADRLAAMAEDSADLKHDVERQATRTDAEFRRLHSTQGSDWNSFCALRDFARQLETELRAAERTFRAASDEQRRLFAEAHDIDQANLRKALAAKEAAERQRVELVAALQDAHDYLVWKEGKAMYWAQQHELVQRIARLIKPLAALAAELKP